MAKKPRKARGPRKRQPATPAPKEAAEKLVLKLKLNPSAFQDPQSPVYKYRESSGAPVAGESAKVEKLPDADGQGRRRGERLRRQTRQPDTAFGSEMDDLITSSVAKAKKVKNDEDVQMVDDSRKHLLYPRTIVKTWLTKLAVILHLRKPARQDSPETVRGTSSPPLPYTSTLSQEVYGILNTLQSSPNFEVDLPNLYGPGGVSKPYTAKLLTDLYIQCYQNQLWHLCDLVSDTWIRALQLANKSTQRSKNVEDHMWRKNAALEKIFAEKKKGYKQDVFEFGLDIEDPELASDVTVIDPERLHDLFAHISPKCGARLLWADAIALCGKKVEHEIVRQPGVWPEELYYNVMCTGLRMVGRKLTLKIEEKYEGAWCTRYHEHGRHGMPCYRRLAWEQKEREGGEESSDEEDAETEAGTRSNGTRAGKRARQSVGEDELGGVKRVRFEAGVGSDVDVIDFGDLGGEDDAERVRVDSGAGSDVEVIDLDDVDAEGVSEEEG